MTVYVSVNFEFYHGLGATESSQWYFNQYMFDAKWN